MVKIVIINGYPGSGKDSFVEYVGEAKSSVPREGALRVINIHTSDLVKDALRPFGYTDDQKHPDVRKLLSDMKYVTSKYWDSSFKYVQREIEKYESLCRQPEDSVVLFVHAREPEEIKRFKCSFDALTLLVDRDEASVQNFSNDSDAGVMNYEYDLVIYNNSTLSDLQIRAKDFLKEVVNDASWSRMIRRKEG